MKAGVGRSNLHKALTGAFLFLLGIAFFLASSHVWAQDVTGSIVGTVVDQTGAAISGASITAKDVNRGTTFTGKTDGSGNFRIERVPIGKYEVRVEASGFQTAVKPAFDLVLNQTARLAFDMQVGQATTTVEVNALPPLLQTDSTEVSTHIDSVAMENLPLITRNYNELTLTTPGAVSTNPGAFVSGQSTFQVGRPYINGNREQTSNYILDGMDNNQHDNNEVAYAPSVDAIQEFHLITQNPSAEFGNFLGGIINTTLKSGTNSYHGSVFWFVRNDIFNANEWSNNLAGKDADGHEVVARPKLRYNQFGATFGGRIVKDKLFFFVDYQGQRMSTPSTQTASVLSQAQRGGDFGQFCTANGGAFNGSGICSNPAFQLFRPQVGVAPGSRVPIPFNNLTGAGLALSPAALAIVNSALYPLPNVGLNRLTYSQRVENNADQGDAKIDWAPNSKDHIFGRYSQQDVENPTTQTFILASNGITNFSYPLKSGVVDWTRTISPSMLNDFRFGASHFPVFQGFSNPTGLNLPQTFGIPGSPSTFLPSIGGFQDGISGIGNNLAQTNVFADTVIQFGDALLLNHGNHEFHTGFQFNRYRDNFLYPGNEGLAGQFGFTGQYTSNAAAGATGSGSADFLLGLPSNLGIGQGVGNRHVNNSLYSAFFQDNWRIKRNLTLNLGLRWELNTPRVAQDGNAVNYSLFGGQLITPTINNNGLGDALYHQYNGIANFQPRIGLAWQPDFVKNTVVRAAWGMSNYTESNGVNNLLTQNPPFETAHNVTFLANTPLPGSTLDQGFTGFPTGCTLALAVAFSPTCFSGVNIHAFDVDLRPTVHYGWNLAVEHQFSNSTTLEIGYVGQANQHLSNIIMLQQKQLNPDGTVSPSPFLNPTLLGLVGQARFTLSNGISNYHALQATLQERFTNGLQAQVNYTWSKCLSDTPGFFGQFGDNVNTQAQTIAGWAFPQNPYDQRGDYGRCPQDVASLFNGYVVYNLPFGHGQHFGNDVPKAVDAIAGGWRISSDFAFHTGFAQTIFASQDLSGTGGFSTRANCVPGVSRRIPFALDPASVAAGTPRFDFLNPASVTQPGPGTFGNCPVGAFRGPGYKSIDLGLAKMFSITEKQNVEFRIEAVNVFNMPIFNFGDEFGGQHTQGAVNFGQISNSQGARNMQLGLKYRF
jgi:hypothetical protein